MEKIDFVIIWVDGGDRAWQKEKNAWLSKVQGRQDTENGSLDAGENRYRDWDILKYWFRAVEKYAPWVNKVHFVTCGHVPPWLNLDAPKLHFVKHSDFIPAEYLPTFSSHPIELNLHRIPGLSDKFVYFNDDFFLGAPTKPEDFFKNGLPCDCLVERIYPMRTYEMYVNIRMNDPIFCNRHFNRMECRKALGRKWFGPWPMAKRNLRHYLLPNTDIFGLDTNHLPQAYLKSTLETVWELEPELLSETSSHKFRDIRDVSQCVFKFYQLLSGRFTPYNKWKHGKYFNLGSSLSDACDALVKKKYEMICFNDTAVSDFEGSKRKIQEAFEAVLPEKSSFER